MSEKRIRPYICLNSIFFLFLFFNAMKNILPHGAEVCFTTLFTLLFASYFCIFAYDFFFKGNLMYSNVSLTYALICFLLFVMAIIRRVNLYNDFKILVYTFCMLFFVAQMPLFSKGETKKAYVLSMIHFFEIFSSLMAFISIITILTNYSYMNGNVWIGLVDGNKLYFIINANLVGVIMALLFYIAFNKIILVKKTHVKVLAAIELVMALVCLYYTQSRGSFYFLILALAFELLICPIKIKKKNMKKRYIVLLFIVLFCVVLLRSPLMKEINRIRGIDSDIRLMRFDETLSSRTILWKESLKLFTQHWALGIGFPDGGNVFVEQYGGILASVDGHSHNFLINLLMDNGIFFFLFAASLLLYALYKILCRVLYLVRSKAESMYIFFVPVFLGLLMWGMIESRIIYANNLISFLFYFILGVLMDEEVYHPEKADSGIVFLKKKFTYIVSKKIVYNLFLFCGFLLPEVTRYISYALIRRDMRFASFLGLPVECPDGIAAESFWKALKKDFSKGRTKRGNSFSKQKKEKKTIYLDISRLNISNIKTGIQRREVESLYYINKNKDESQEIYLVYFSPIDNKYKYAVTFANEYPRISKSSQEEIKFSKGDLVLICDFVIVGKNGLGALRRKGVEAAFICDDMIPVNYPILFKDPSNIAFNLSYLLSHASRVYGVSETTIADIRRFVSQKLPFRDVKLSYEHIYCGCDLNKETKELSEEEEKLLEPLKGRKYALSVGTLSDPRKSFDVAINSFYGVWDKYPDTFLVIVGRSFKKNSKLEEAVSRAKRENRRLLILEGVSDALLRELYKRSSLFYYCTYAEGFGIPLLEAVDASTPILVRDLPIFREIVGDEAYYFKASDIEGIAKEVLGVFDLINNSSVHIPAKDKVCFYSWEDFSNKLLNCLIS